MGLDDLLQGVLRTYHWFHPTFFHSCLEDACELLKFLLGERDKCAEFKFAQNYLLILCQPHVPGTVLVYEILSSKYFTYN